MVLQGTRTCQGPTTSGSACQATTSGRAWGPTTTGSAWQVGTTGSAWQVGTTGSAWQAGTTTPVTSSCPVKPRVAFWWNALLRQALCSKITDPLSK